MLSRLRSLPGRQLVIVHYALDDYAVGLQWVYNRADIGTAKVVWAHDMGPAENEKLIKYFKYRHVWLIDVDNHPPKLEPYSQTADRRLLAARGTAP